MTYRPLCRREAVSAAVGALLAVLAITALLVLSKTVPVERHDLGDPKKAVKS